MPRLLALLSLPTLAALVLLGSASAAAQDNRWFRVELLVFANQAAAAAPAGAASQEQWEATPQLDYPDAARFLIYPDQVRANLREYPGNSIVDKFGRQIITVPGAMSTGAIVPPRPVIDTSAAAPGGAPVAQANDPDPVATGAAARPVPFVVLPHSYQQLRGKAALMQRSGRYDILFHETWVQPVPSEATSLPIVLDRSGDTGQWPRLQGSIKLYLTRYLQVETNLWLNTDGSYMPGSWQMPAPPLSPPSLIIEEPLPAGGALPTPAGAVGTTAQGALPAGDAAPGDTGAMLPEEANLAGTDTLQDGLAEVIPELEPGPVYPFRHAVALQQKARMRSNETHYIDHPLLGVIIRFTPATAEDLAAIAAQQPTLPGNQAP